MINTLEIKLDTNTPGHRQKKWECPACGHKRRFVRYYNFTENEYLPYHFGRCDREEKCGYFHKLTGEQLKEHDINCTTVVNRDLPRLPRLSRLNKDFLLDSLKAYDKNTFCLFLKNHFGNESGKELIDRFAIGTSKKYKGATVFWQVDEIGQVRTGKIMLYRPDGHRRKDINPTWVHSELKLKDFNLQQCFFGEHQLQHANPRKIVAVVESEKTAVIASYFFPKYIWLATGGMHMLNPDKCKVLDGRRVVFFPDLSYEARSVWQDKAEEISKKINVSIVVSDYLNEINDGSDIADYLLAIPIRKRQPAKRPSVYKLPSAYPDDLSDVTDLLTSYISSIQPALINDAKECPF